MSDRKFELEAQKIYERKWLATLMGVDDRTMRERIRSMRRDGVPIVALPDGGYKIAETPEEKALLLNQYRKRAMDELVTLSKLIKAMQLEGQISYEEFISEVNNWYEQANMSDRRSGASYTVPLGGSANGTAP